MGCASSKIDDLPAVILCRERLDFLSQALHQRYAFAEAHVAYIHSLDSLGVSLRRFFDSSTSIPPPSASPVINLPPQRKVVDDGHHDDDDDTGSHLHFHSDSDSDDDELHHDDHDDDELHHDDHDDDGEIRHHVHENHDSPPRGGMMYDGGGPVGGGGGGGNGFGFNPYLYSNGGNGYGYNNNGGNMHVNYMKKHVTPSVSYEQRPVSYETERVQFGDPNAASSSSSSSNYYDYFGVSGGGATGGPNYNNYYNNNTASNNSNNGYMNMNMNYGGGFYGAPGANPRGWNGVGGGGGPQLQQQQQAKAAPPPPPPPPPSTSSWDFMNLFDSIDNHYQSYAPSRDSREVREEEGIPDLEDEDGHHEHEVVKEVHGNQKLVDDNGGHISGSSSGSTSISSSEGRNESKNEEVVEGESSLYRASNEGVPVEYEVHLVDKKVVGDPGKPENQAKAGGKPVFRNVFEVVQEIQVQFERAASSGNELTKVLEVGKHRYHRKGGAYHVSAKMLNVITPSLPSSSKDASSLAVDEDVQLRSVNLSATLQKLYLWEKKLFEEVKGPGGAELAPAAAVPVAAPKPYTIATMETLSIPNWNFLALITCH